MQDPTTPGTVNPLYRVRMLAHHTAVVARTERALAEAYDRDYGSASEVALLHLEVAEAHEGRVHVARLLGDDVLAGADALLAEHHRAEAEELGVDLRAEACR